MFGLAMGLRLWRDPVDAIVQHPAHGIVPQDQGVLDVDVVADAIDESNHENQLREEP